MESGDGGSSGENNVKNPTSTPGCGCHNGAAISTVEDDHDESILVRVTPTTGGQYDILVCKNESVENLKKRLSKKLKVPKERICLLHRDRQLRDGSLHENQLVDGSRLTLLPSVETGLLAQRPEQSVMQALESLNDSQVNDFLSGKAPLNLTMRLGDHMMLIQLQLSTVTPKLSSSSSSSSSKGSRPSSTTSSTSSSTTTTTTSPRVRPVTTTTSTSTTTPPPSSSTCRCEPSTSSSTTSPSSSTNNPKQPAALDTRALAEASRNLTQTLKQLSSEVLTSRSTSSNVVTTSSSSLEFNEQVSRRSTSTSSSSSSTPTPSRSSRQPAALDTESSRRRQGAIIESMHHHGKGVYSGTFSGTLNPALQDKFGRPKRDISTIIHILNDLLCATPQYRGHAQRRSQAAAAAAQAANLSTPNTPETAEGEGSAQLSKENQATRGKMEQLRQFMEERRARRRARREARVAPYSTAQWAGSKCGTSSQAPVSPSPAPSEGRPCVASIAASATPEGAAATPMDTSETAPELCPELNPEPVMA